MPAAQENDNSGEPGVAPELPAGAEPFVILKQDVELEVHFREKSISGVSTIHLFTINPDLDEIWLDARQCEIDVKNVTVDGFKTTASFSDPYDLARTPRAWQLGATQHHIVKRRMAPLRPARRPEVPNKDRETLPCCVPADRSLRVSLRPDGMFKDEPRKTLKIKTLKAAKDAPLDRPDPNDEKNGIKVSIPFRSKNIRDGLHFVGVDEGDLRYPHVYTRHSLELGTASCIFPCVDDPGSRHPWKISIKCPRTLGDVFEQPLTTQQSNTQSPDAVRKRKLGEAHPTFSTSPPLAEEDKLMEMTVVCSGNLAGEQIDPEDDKKKIMTFESQLSAAQHIAFAIGPFEHIQLWSEFRTEEADEKLGANAAKIHAYCLPNRAHDVRHTCGPIVAAADFFAPEFGRYPFESYKVCFVDDMVSDTVAATSMSLCSNRLLYPEVIIDPEIEVTRKLVHALASQYFGVHVVPNQRSDSWLIVGIQWFMTDLFMRSICGNNWYRFHLKTLSDKLVETDVHRPSLHDLGEYLHIGDFELEFMSLKAPLVLFILDQRMSKIPGSMGIVRVISQIVSNANINATITSTSLADADFRRACEKKSQYRPDELWQQWVHGAGCPKLLIKQRFNKKNLNVDISIAQTQSKDNGPKAITKDEFLKELLEEVYEVWAGPVPKLFTGPFTVRIHEADGTPYEHYLAITDKDKVATTLQIAYNTKYKRMKRTKKATAAAAAANSAGDKHDIQEDDIVYFNMLGDVLMSPRDIENWGLQDWSESVQAAMDQESYEWIRLDCNFEWLCEMITDMPGYMYLAQLQQDRDVVAHQDAMLFFKRGKRHGVASSIETRTVMDRRYYHGIRTMAIDDLPKQADPEINYIGTAQLILLYRHFFCHRIVGKNGSVTFPPAPNDFYDKAQYAVQCALPAAIARTRENGRCSRRAREFLLDLLLFNDNSDNEYSDQFYIAKLLEALTTSIIPDKWESERDLYSSLRTDDDDDLEFKTFIEKAIEEIEKYRRMDEWTSTYHNIWTRTALHCKMRLMKANVIRTEPLEFVRYLQDENLDLIRIEAFDCLVELGLLAKVPIMKLLLASVSTDPSPFVRDRLFKIFCKGMAAVALGESKAAQAEPEAPLDDIGLVVEQGEAEIQQRQLAATRNQSIHAALGALKEELKGNTELQTSMWRAVESPSISVKEKFQLLAICSAMFEAEDSLLTTFNYPRVWRCTREPAVEEPFSTQKPRKRCIVRFTTHYRTKPRHKLLMDSAPPPAWEASAPADKATEPSAPTFTTVPSTTPASTAPKKIRLSANRSFTGSTHHGPSTPAPQIRKDSIPVTEPRPAVPAKTDLPSSDSISVQPLHRLPTSLAGPAASSPVMSSQQLNGTARPAEKRPKPPKKRKSDDGDGIDRPKKVARGDIGANGQPRKIVKIPFSAWDRLPSHIRDRIRAEKAAPPASSTIRVTPAQTKRTALPCHPVQYADTPTRPAVPAADAQAPAPNGGQSIIKQRKALPSSPRPQLARPPSTPTVETGEPKKKIIKLKFKPASHGASHGASQVPPQTSPPQTPR